MSRIPSLPRADVLLAVALATYGFAEGLLARAPAGWLAAVPVLTLPLALRRRHPVATIGVVLAGLCLAPLAIDTDGFGSVLPLPLLIVAGYTAGHEARSGRRALLAAVTVGAVAWLAWLIAPDTDNSRAEDAVAITVLVGGAAGAGRIMRVRQAENARLRELTLRLEAETDARARAAVMEERARVARELHDVVAHGISLIAVQAGAAEELLGRDDRRAREALTAVQRTARDALAEMRRLLTVLRDDEPPPGLTPQPGLSALEDLVEQARAGGLPVRLREEGERPDMAAGVGLSAYRIVQEALTNVRRHAGQRAETEVVVRYDVDAVRLEVSNADPNAGARAAGNGADPGHGMIGMRERVRIYGGTLEAGPRRGRYVVTARLPLRGAPE